MTEHITYSVVFCNNNRILEQFPVKENFHNELMELCNNAKYCRYGLGYTLKIDNTNNTRCEVQYPRWL